MPRTLRFALAIAVVILYPVVDNALGWGTLGAMLPILIFVMLALGLNIVVGYAGLLDLGYAAFFAIGAYTTAFLTSPQSVLPFRTDFWVAMVASLARHSSRVKAAIVSRMMRMHSRRFSNRASRSLNRGSSTRSSLPMW